MTKSQLCRIVEDYGAQRLIDCVSFNPTKKMVGFYRWSDFLKNMSSDGDVPIQYLDKDDPLVMKLDSGAKVFRYPLYVIVSENSQAKVHEVEIPTINPGDALPIFTNEDSANAALRKLTGNYRVQSLGQSGTIKFLKVVVLPRKIERCILNPELEGDVHELIDIAHLIAELERSVTDEEIREMVTAGHATEI